MTSPDTPSPQAAPPREPTPPGQEVASAKNDLRVAVGEDGPVVRHLEIEVGIKRVARAFERAYRDLAKHAQVKGFRKGKVPRSVLEKMYGPGLGPEVERQLVSETLPDAVELSGYWPIVEPAVDAKPPVDGEPFGYTVRLEIRPEIELPELVGLAGERPATEVGEAEVESRLADFQEQGARPVEEPEETPAENGHILKVDFEGRIDGELFEGGSAEGVEMELGSGRFIPGFEEQLVGACAGEERKVEVGFPEDYGVEALRGKPAIFDVKVGAVSRREKPELDDEFAKDLGDFDSLDALRARIREDMEKQRQGAAEAALRTSVMDSLIAQTSFDVGPAVVERQLDAQIASLQQRFRGQVPEEVMQEQLQRAREEGQPSAERRVRERLLLDEVAKFCEIEIGDEDLQERLGEMAASQGADLAQFEQFAREQGWLEALRAELREERALDWLVGEADVTDSA